MPEDAYIDVTHSYPESDTGLVGRAVVQVRYGPNEAQIDMSLKPAVTLDKLEELDLAPQVRELGEALVRIASKQPVKAPRPHQST